MGADSDSVIRVKADQQLQEIDKKYPGFIQVSVIYLSSSGGDIFILFKRFTTNLL